MKRYHMSENLLIEDKCTHISQKNKSLTSIHLLKLKQLRNLNFEKNVLKVVKQKNPRKNRCLSVYCELDSTLECRIKFTTPHSLDLSYLSTWSKLVPYDVKR